MAALAMWQSCQQQRSPHSTSQSRCLASMVHSPSPLAYRTTDASWSHMLSLCRYLCEVQRFSHTLDTQPRYLPPAIHTHLQTETLGLQEAQSSTGQHDRLPLCPQDRGRAGRQGLCQRILFGSREGQARPCPQTPCSLSLTHICTQPPHPV